MALGARLGHRFVPNGKFTLRVPAAAVEGLSPSGSALHQPAVAFFFRASDSGILAVAVDRFGVFAFGVAGAGQKPTEAALLGDQGTFTFGAGLVGFFIGCQLDRLDVSLFIPLVIVGIVAVGVGVTRQEMSVSAHLDVQLAGFAFRAG